MSAFIQDQNRTRKDYQDEELIKNPSLISQAAASNTTKGLVLLLIFAVVVPFLIYYFMYDCATYPKPDLHICAVMKTYKVPCGNPNATYAYCEMINCCYDNSTNLCYHYLPSKYYYSLNNSTDKYQPSLKTTPFNTESTSEIALTINEIDKDRVKIVLHDPKVVVEKKEISIKNYYYQRHNDPLVVQFFRNNNKSLLNTALGPMIISTKYWEWSFQLTDDYLFGLGETSIKLDENSTLTKVIYNSKKDHNTLPIFMAYKDNAFHGLIIRHSGPLEVSVLPSKLVILKSLVGQQIELELSLGPTPKDVLRQQQTQLLNLPKPWVLGLHICRSGNSINLKELLDMYEEFISKNAHLRYESHCIHENLFIAMILNKDEAQLKRLRNDIHLLRANRKFILFLPPQVPIQSAIYEHAASLNIFYTDDKQNLYEGKYLNLSVVYPYFGYAAVDDFISIIFNEIKNRIGFVPDTLTLNSNWPVEDSFQMKQDNFPYLSQKLQLAMSSTLPWDAQANNELHIAQHNDYGSLQLRAVERALSSLNPSAETVVMTASHNLEVSNPLVIQDVNISWTDFQTVIRQNLYNSIFVNPLISTPVCGSSSNYDSQKHSELCIRWYLMAATAPVFRISSEIPLRDPENLYTKFAKQIVKIAIETRNQLQPYYYTILSRGEPIMRPMFYDFPEDNTTFNIDNQYMIGSQILVAHPFYPDKTQMRLYLPKSVNIWYEMWGGVSYDLATRPDGFLVLNIVETDWISFVAEGSIIPMVEVEEGKTLLNLIVALICAPDCIANGSLLQGSSTLKILATDSYINVTGITDAAKESMECASKKFIFSKLSLYAPTDIYVANYADDLCNYNGEATILFWRKM